MRSIPHIKHWDCGSVQSNTLVLKILVLNFLLETQLLLVELGNIPGKVQLSRQTSYKLVKFLNKYWFEGQVIHLLGPEQKSQPKSEQAT